MRDRKIFLNDLSVMITKTNEMFSRDFLSEGLRTKYGIEIQTSYILSELSKRNSKDYKNCVDAQTTYDIFYTMRNELFIAIDLFSSDYLSKQLVCDLRKCKSWREVMDLENNFTKLLIKFFKNLNSKITTQFLNTEQDSYLFYYLYLIFLANTGVCAIVDSLYEELNVDQDEPRAKFDYFNDGLPLTSVPIAPKEVSEIEEKEIIKEDVFTIFNEFSDLCEESFNEIGSLNSSILSNSKYLALITACTRTELMAEKMDRVKYRKTLREYIHVTELIALALYEADVNIDNKDYINLAIFNDDYSKKLENARTIEEAMKIFEDNFDKFNSLTKNFKNGIIEFGENLMSIPEMLDLKIVAPLEVSALYIQKSEYLVMMQHLTKVRELAMYALEERLSYEIEIASYLFKRLEERLEELKSNKEINTQSNISIKKFNKKIAKYKKVFDFKTLNKMAHQAGFEKVRQKGDHGIFKSISGEVVVIPQGRNIGKGLSCKIQRDIIQSVEQQEVAIAM